MLIFDAPIGAGHLPEPIQRFGEILTDFGDSAWLILTSVLLFFHGRAGYKLLNSAKARAQALYVSWIGAFLFTTVVFSGLLANLLKRTIGRARPEHFQDLGVLSFTPFSGHLARHDARHGRRALSERCHCRPRLRRLVLAADGNRLCPLRPAFQTCARWLAYVQAVLPGRMRKNGA
jgi:hypothetical protein